MDWLGFTPGVLGVAALRESLLGLWAPASNVLMIIVDDLKINWDAWVATRNANPPGPTCQKVLTNAFLHLYDIRVAVLTGRMPAMSGVYDQAHLA